MSGIFGFYTKSILKEGDRSEISGMLSWNRAYGNACEGVYECMRGALGCCVESLSESHVQSVPVLKADGKSAVIDALIFNREYLIEKTAASSDIPDAELLLRYIIKCGPEALKDVNGDFCGAVLDEEKGSLLLFRDHMGIRPLYYYRDDGCVAFSTDLRGLIALPLVDTDIDKEWIYGIVAKYDADTLDNTPYIGIRCVTPATYMTFTFTGEKIKSRQKAYWKLGSRRIRLSSEQEYVKELRALITDAVRRRLDAISGIVGAELSGGLDSGVIDILINRAGREGVYYSWSPDPEEVEYAENDERLVIRDICAQENITCNFAPLSGSYENGTAEVMEKAQIRIPQDGSPDFRFAFLPSNNTYYIIRGAQFVKSKGTNVLFTGHGGDEGVSHRMDPYEMFWHREYYHYLKHIWSVTKGRRRALRTIKKTLKAIVFSIREKRETYIGPYASPELLKDSFVKTIRKRKEGALQFGYDPKGYIRSGGSRNRLDNMALLGAYGGIRYLVPYLDHRVIDYAVSIPRYLYIRGGVTRYIFREAFKDIMPESLYRLNVKEDTSARNIKSQEDWYEGFARRKAEIIGHLDRDYWSSYLDFEKIDALAKKGRPSDEEYGEDLSRVMVLLKCALAQNVIDVAGGK